VPSSHSLVSKLLAAGLSAGVFLLWWPRHYPTEGLEPLIMRGTLWALSFEFLLLGFAPLEAQVRERLARRGVGSRLNRARGRLSEAPARARMGGALALAVVAAAIPAAMLATAPAEGGSAKAAQPKVVRQVIVKREVKRIYVNRIVQAPAGLTERTSPAPVSRPVATKPAAAKTPVPAPKAETKAEPRRTAEPKAPKVTEPQRAQPVPSQPVAQPAPTPDSQPAGG
jgi:hypothetical protein